MLKVFKSGIRLLLNSFGFEIYKLENHIASKDKSKWLDILKIDLILDIGANQGQFALEIHKVLPNAKIIAFEPMEEAYSLLLKNTKSIKNINTFNNALGDNDEDIEMNISMNSYSSSLLPISNLSTDLFPDSKYIKKEIVKVVRLDNALNSDDFISNNILTKIDVQGFEKNVIKGGEKIILQSAAIIIEYTFSRLYEDQWLFKDTFEYFTKNGFTFLGNADQVLSKKNGIPVYGDAIFVKNAAVDSLYL